MAQALLLPAYLIVGPNELKKDQALARLKKRAEGDFEAFNLEELDGATIAEPDGLLSSLNALPFGADQRIVIVRNAEKMPKPVSEAVIKYLAAPNEACVMCLVATTLAKSTRLYKAVAKIDKKAVIECSAVEKRELAPYVQKLAAAHGASIDFDAAQELVARAGDNPQMLDNQVVGLVNLLGGAGTITRSFVEANVARTAEVKPWDFLNYISARDTKQSLETLVLLLDNSPLGLLSLITTRLRELTISRALTQRGQSASIAAALNKQSWQTKNYSRWSMLFNDQELEHCLTTCAATESALKSGADPQTHLTRLILQICTPTPQ